MPWLQHTSKPTAEAMLPAGQLSEKGGGDSNQHTSVLKTLATPTQLNHAWQNHRLTHNEIHASHGHANVRPCQGKVMSCKGEGMGRTSVRSSAIAAIGSGEREAEVGWPMRQAAVMCFGGGPNSECFTSTMRLSSWSFGIKTPSGSNRRHTSSAYGLCAVVHTDTSNFCFV